jgi:hypothetical protein
LEPGAFQAVGHNWIQLAPPPPGSMLEPLRLWWRALTGAPAAREARTPATSPPTTQLYNSRSNSDITPGGYCCAWGGSCGGGGGRLGTGFRLADGDGGGESAGGGWWGERGWGVEMPAPGRRDCGGVQNNDRCKVFVLLVKNEGSALVGSGQTSSSQTLASSLSARSPLIGAHTQKGERSLFRQRRSLTRATARASGATARHTLHFTRDHFLSLKTFLGHNQRHC